MQFKTLLEQTKELWITLMSGEPQWMARMIRDLRYLYHFYSVPHIPGVSGLSSARSGSVIVQSLEKVVSMMHNAEFTWGADQVEPAVKVVRRVVRA